MIKPALAVAVVIVLGLGACAPNRHQPSGSEVDLLTLQRKLSESEEKIDQLTQRMTLIQIIVDSHQRAIRDLSEGATADGMDTDIPLLPSSPEKETLVSETATPEKVAEPQPTGAKQYPGSEEKLIIPEPNPKYQEAMEIFRSGDYETATGLFETFVQQFPQDDLADNALYWSGECRYAQKNFDGAIKQFRQVIEDYPSGGKVPDALLKIGFAHLSLGDKKSAITYLKRVVSQYPFSIAGGKAEERLKTLQK